LKPNVSLAFDAADVSGRGGIVCGMASRSDMVSVTAALVIAAAKTSDLAEASALHL